MTNKAGKQSKELHYHEYCTGHGFQDTIDEEWETCGQCGDIASRYVYSFSNKEEFVRQCMYDLNFQWLGLYEEVHFLTYEDMEKASIKRDRESFDHDIKRAEEAYDELFDSYNGIYERGRF